MGTRKPWTFAEASEESAHIQRVAHSGKLGNFNDSPECFAGYCAMQAKFAELDGFGDLAGLMRRAESFYRGKVVR